MAIKLNIELIRFLNAAKSMYSQGNIKKEEIIEFLIREFGDVSSILKNRLDKIIKKQAKRI